MEMHITHINGLEKFVQILDSNFPSGSFVHSFGLEPHIVLEKVKNEDDLKIFLQNIILDQYSKMEFVFCRKIYNNFKNNNLKAIVKLDNTYNAMLNYEFSKASCDIGLNYLKHIRHNIKKKIVKQYFEKIQNKKSSGNELAILSAYAYELDFDIDLLLLFWCKKNIVNISQTALKISRIQPSKIQKLLFELDDFIKEKLALSNEIMQNFNPSFEEIIYSHKHLEPKLFIT